MSDVAAAARNRGASLTSVVMVAADSGPGLLDSAASVLRSTVELELIVVDNASADGSVESVAQRWRDDARVRIVRNARNLGFGAGCNRGAALARGEALLFLNPDCAVAPETIGRACEAMSPGLGLLGVCIVDGHGNPEAAARRRDPLLRRSLMSVSGLARFQSRWPCLEGVEIPPSGKAPPLETVDAISGALMLLPRAVFDGIGGFDEGYFLHAEDLDLCRRVRDSGLAVACANDIKVQHGKGGSSRHRPLFVAWHKHRGMWRWFTKFDPAARNPLLRALVWFGLALHFAVLSPIHAWRQQVARNQR